MKTVSTLYPKSNTRNKSLVLAQVIWAYIYRAKHDISCPCVCVCVCYHRHIRIYLWNYASHQIDILQPYSKSDFASKTLDLNARTNSGDPQGSSVWIKTAIFLVFLE